MFLSTFAHRGLVALALFAVALPASAQKLSTPQKKSPPTAAPPVPRPAEPAQKPATPATKRTKPLAPGLRGEASNAEENDGKEADPVFDAKALMSKSKAAASGVTSTAVHLANHPKRDELAKFICDSVRGREIDVALLGGEKYMINSCLGIKVSSGKFRLKLDNPSLRFENSGIALTFSIDNVSFSAIKLRMRPNPNVLEVCSFSKKFEVGGSMDDVRLTMRFDPLYDIERCRVGNVTDLNPEVRIGNLNLKPLQNDLDRMAKNMVEDALTFALQYQCDGVLSAMGDLVFSAVDQFLEADCPTQPGDTGRAITGATKTVKGLGGSGTGSSSGKGGGGAPTGTSSSDRGAPAAPAGGAAPSASNGSPAVPPNSSPNADAAQIEMLMERIEELEARIAELEASGFESAGVQGSTAGSDDIHGDDIALLLREILSQEGGLSSPEVASQIFSEVLGQLLEHAQQSSGSFDARSWLVDRAGQMVNASASPAPAASTPAAPLAPWHIVPNPALTGRMGRIVVRFPDKELGEKTHVAVFRDGKKVTDKFGEAGWEFLPGVHDVVVTSAKVTGCEVRSGCDTIVRVGMLQVELGGDTFFAIFPKGGPSKLYDTYGSATLGLPIGEYEVEVQGQRAPVVVREGEITRF